MTIRRSPVLLKQVRKQKLGAYATGQGGEAAPTNASPSRTIPAAVRREVYRRDQGRCTFE